MRGLLDNRLAKRVRISIKGGRRRMWIKLTERLEASCGVGVNVVPHRALGYPNNPRHIVARVPESYQIEGV